MLDYIAVNAPFYEPMQDLLFAIGLIVLVALHSMGHKHDTGSPTLRLSLEAAPFGMYVLYSMAGKPHRIFFGAYRHR
jgi:hypothetical protein